MNRLNFTDYSNKAHQFKYATEENSYIFKYDYSEDFTVELPAKRTKFKMKDVSSLKILKLINFNED